MVGECRRVGYFGVFSCEFFKSFISKIQMANLNQEYQDYVNQSFGEISKNLRKDSRSLHNRIQSIISDSKFVTSVSSAYNLPLVGMSYYPLL